MKILHVIPSVTLRDGGPSVAVKAMARGLVALGNAVTIVTTNADRELRLPVPLDVPVLQDGVTFRYFGFHWDWKYSPALARWLDCSISKFDVVHVHALFSYPTIPGCRISVRKGVPFILRPLGTLDPWCLSHGRLKKMIYLRAIERRHLETASLIHCTSEKELAGIEALGFGRRARVIPLGVEYAPLGRDTLNHIGNPLRLLFLSRVDPIKGLPLLLEAVRLLRHSGILVELEIAGSGEPSYVSEMERRVRNLGIDGCVRFSGHVTGEEKGRAFARADVFVLPSYHENFGIAVLEALAAGLPVVVSEGVGLAPEIMQSQAGLVTALDPMAIVRAIKTLAEDHGLRDICGQNAARLARQKFNWSATCERLEEAYRDAIAYKRSNNAATRIPMSS